MQAFWASEYREVRPGSTGVVPAVPPGASLKGPFGESDSSVTRWNPTVCDPFPDGTRT